MLGKILDCLNHAKRECIPKKKLRRDGNQPYHRPLWMDHRTLTAIRRKHQMWKRYLRTQQGADYVEFAQARNKARKATRLPVRLLEKKIAKEAKQNPKYFWKYASTKMRTRTGVAEVQMEQCDQRNPTGKCARSRIVYHLHQRLAREL